MYSLGHFLSSRRLHDGRETALGAGEAQSVQCLTTDWTIGDRSRQRKRIFPHPLCPDQLWGPHSHLSNGYRGSFPRGLSAAGAWRWPLTPRSAEVENE
jgi:hypothetical protein